MKLILWLIFVPIVFNAKADPVDWKQFNDSILIKVERLPGHKMGNTICTGVVIHPRVIATTAHCADEATSMNIVFDVENGESASKIQKVVKSEMLVHPNYLPKKSLYKNDLVLLFLDKPSPVLPEFIRKLPKKNPLKNGDRLTRIGVGLRNNKNLRNTTNPIYVKNPEKGVMETSDIYSYFGDSGGPLYNLKHELLAIHSTIDDFDGKKTPHAFSVYLPDYQDWIDQSIKLYLQKHP